MIPESCSLHVGLVATKALYEQLSFLRTRPYDIDFSPVSEWAFFEAGIHRFTAQDLYPEHACLGGFAMDSVRETPRLMTTSITRKVDTVVYGLCGWFEAKLSPSVTLSTSPFAPATHWYHFHFPFVYPLHVAADDAIDIEVEIVPQRGQNGYRWKARTSDGWREGDSLEYPR